MSAPKYTNLVLSLLTVDDAFQPRLRLDEATVQRYASAMSAGVWQWEENPPVVFYDGEVYRLADGDHRVAAMRRLGIQSAPFDVRPGGHREAVFYAMTANRRHGLQRTAADERRATDRLLADAEWSRWSDTALANDLGVGVGLVKERRDALQMALPIADDVPPVPIRAEASVSSPGRFVSQAETVPAPCPVDALGRVVPARLVSKWLGWRRHFPDADLWVGRGLEAARAWPAEERPAGVDDALRKIEEGFAALRALAPQRVCEDCSGEGCASCNGRGYL